MTSEDCVIVSKSLKKSNNLILFLQGKEPHDIQLLLLKVNQDTNNASTTTEYHGGKSNCRKHIESTVKHLYKTCNIHNVSDI